MARPSKGAAKSKKRAAPARKPAGKKSAAADHSMSEAAESELNLPKERDREHWFRTLKGSSAKIAEAQSFHRDQSKKAQEAGIDTKALMDTIRDEKKDPLAVEAYLRQKAQFYKDRGMPMQFQLFDAKFGNSVAQAKSEGRRAGENSQSPECRWPEGTPEAEAYMAEWMAVQAERVPGGDGTDAVKH